MPHRMVLLTGSTVGIKLPNSGMVARYLKHWVIQPVNLRYLGLWKGLSGGYAKATSVSLFLKVQLKQECNDNWVYLRRKT